MDDLLDRFRRIEENPSPDLWAEIQNRRRLVGQVEGHRGPRQRLTAGLVAAVIAVLAIGSLIAVFRPAPAPPATFAGSVGDGPLVLVGIQTPDRDVVAPYGGSQSLFALNPATGELSRATPALRQADPLTVPVPRWTPDGARVLWYTPDAHNGPGSIWTDVAGAFTSIVSCRDFPCVWDPAWSPDGRVIAFVRGESIFAVNADGSDLHKVVTCPDCTGLESGPTWSPDGSRFAFSASSARYAGVIYVVNADGTGLRPITECDTDLCHSGVRDGNVEWSPAGDSLIFTRERNLWSVRPDGSGLIRLTSCVVTERPNPCSPETVAWSPDATEIAYSREDAEVVVMSPDGSSPRVIPLLEGWTYYLDTWQPVPAPEVVPSTMARPCEAGGILTLRRCPEGRWARAVALRGRYGIAGTTVTATTLRGHGALLSFWAEPTSQGTLGIDPATAGFTLVETIGGTRVYTDGSGFLWQLDGLDAWVSPGPGQTAPITIEQIRPLVIASHHVPFQP